MNGNRFIRLFKAFQYCKNESLKGIQKTISSSAHLQQAAKYYPINDSVFNLTDEQKHVGLVEQLNKDTSSSLAFILTILSTFRIKAKTNRFQFRPK